MKVISERRKKETGRRVVLATFHKDHECVLPMLLLLRKLCFDLRLHPLCLRSYNWSEASGNANMESANQVSYYELSAGI